MSGSSSKRALVATTIVLGVLLGGCVTTDPSITAETADSNVFDSVSVSESWASQQVRASATLASSPQAGNVTQLTVIDENGGSVSTVSLDPGQTSVTLTLPANANATIVASDTVNGTTIEKFNVSTGGNKVL